MTQNPKGSTKVALDEIKARDSAKPNPILEAADKNPKGSISIAVGETHGNGKTQNTEPERVQQQ
ncbi:hypothetical protein AR685_04250 [Chryseobacterium sp. JAH]|nr:hypothetical protein AR685_04250 [Chryseobacterium sp. JAH]